MVLAVAGSNPVIHPTFFGVLHSFRGCLARLFCVRFGVLWPGLSPGGIRNESQGKAYEHMKDVPVADVRNFVLVGHTGSGKTALIDSLLYKLGANDRLGNPGDGTSMADWTDEE